MPSAAACSTCRAAFSRSPTRPPFRWVRAAGWGQCGRLAGSSACRVVAKPASCCWLISSSPWPSAHSAAHAAVGVFPFKTVVSGRKLSMGYVEVATREGCPLFPAGARVRGQVHHHSEIVQVRCGLLV